MLVTEGKFLDTARAATEAVDSIRIVVTVDAPADGTWGQERVIC